MLIMKQTKEEGKHEEGGIDCFGALMYLVILKEKC